MLPLKRIVSPTDFSEPSYEGLKVADEIAGHFSSELIILNVISPIHMLPAPSPSMGTYIQTVLNDMEKSAINMLEDLKNKKISKQVTTKTKVIIGNPADEIIKAAEADRADIIIMATHGQSGWQRFVSGSVAERVVRMASCPVLTIHASHAEGS